ncbi:MAG TPA: T9SS type A sorting domain-containing protein [Flavobacteriaceae bacterium]|nr:T9SS type A sorting domain-containing protein [Flavobacteriaceae bacterium]
MKTTACKGLRHLLFLSVVLILFPSKVFSQYEFLGTWELDKIVIDNQTTFYDDYETYLYADEMLLADGKTNDVLEILLEYRDEDCYLTGYGLETSEYDFDSSTFVVIGIYRYFDQCTPESLADELKELHNSFYFTETSEEEEFTYVITENPEDYILEVINNQGNQAYYSRKNLSTPEFEKLNFTLSPNPVQNQLFIQMKDFTSAMNLEVYDMQGRVINSFDIHKAETQLDVSGYNSGMYFIKLSDGSGKQQVAKFMKR